MNIRASFLFGFLFITMGTSSAYSACFDVSKGEPSHLSGRLSHRIFAGPPNFEDVQKGDTPEPGYAALHSGDGALASSFVVPEKTSKGPYAPQALASFYGSLTEPLTLTDIEPIGDGRFSVRYYFRSSAATCNGAATVTTVERGGRNFIQSISTTSGC